MGPCYNFSFFKKKKKKEKRFNIYGGKRRYNANLKAKGLKELPETTILKVCNPHITKTKPTSSNNKTKRPSQHTHVIKPTHILSVALKISYANPPDFPFF